MLKSLCILLMTLDMMEFNLITVIDLFDNVSVTKDSLSIQSMDFLLNFFFILIFYISKDPGFFFLLCWTQVTYSVSPVISLTKL